jgi:regulator of chromosome condensation
VSGDIFVVGDGDCGQLGKGEDVAEALRPAPSPIDDDKKARPGRDLALQCVVPAAAGVQRVAEQRALQEGCAGCLVAQVTQVAAGGMHSVALTSDGEVWTTGVNDEGALGRETGAALHPAPLRNCV